VNGSFSNWFKIDNDGPLDGLCDMPGAICSGSSPGDPGCVSWLDPSEADPPIELKCHVKPSCDLLNDGEKEVLRITKRIVPLNQHASLLNHTESLRVCCSYLNYFDVCQTDVCGGSSIKIVELDKERNAHVRDPLAAGDAYFFPVSMNTTTTQNLNCQYETAGIDDEDDCNVVGHECLFSASAQTNAHIGNCSDFRRKMCCWYS